VEKTLKSPKDTPIRTRTPNQTMF